MTTPNDTTALWKNLVSPQYQDHPRSHDYALTPEAQRQLVALHRACRDIEPDQDKANELFTRTRHQELVLVPTGQRPPSREKRRCRHRKEKDLQ
jgi:hypothetical protein